MNRRLLLALSLLVCVSACGGEADPSGPSFPTLAITTTSLPDAVATVGYDQTLTASGGDGSYSWTVASGSPPTGLGLTTNGNIAGTPTVVGTQNFTVQVTSGDGQTAQQALSITAEALPVLQSSELCSAFPDYAIATFEDARLEAAVRFGLPFGTQELTCGLLTGVTAVAGAVYGITSLVGIQNLPSLNQLGLFRNSISDVSLLSRLTSLEILILAENSITDISAVSGLTGLFDLILDDNLITDISAVSGLTGLSTLTFKRNSITDISALSGLTSLETLYIGENSITDISALSGLTSLEGLLLDNNSITDVSPLSGLNALMLLRLNDNSITDIAALAGLALLGELQLQDNTSLSNIQPLLDNTGLGSGDTVDLRSTSVSCADVAALEAKGATVNSDCP